MEKEEKSNEDSDEELCATTDNHLDVPPPSETQVHKDHRNNKYQSVQQYKSQYK